MTGATTRRLTMTLTVVATLAAPALASAQGTGELAEAEAAYAQVDFENVLTHAQAAIEAGGLAPAQLTRAYELIGISAMALEDRDRSRQAFVNMLALDPDAQLEHSLSPTLREPFMEARGFWATQTGRLGVEVDLVRDRGALRITLTDPVHIARTIVVHARVAGTTDYAESRETAAASTYVTVAGADDTPRVEYTLTLLDEHDNQLLSLGDDEVPEEVGDAPSAGGSGTIETPRSRTWVWVVVGIVAAAAVGGGVAAGVILGQQANTVRIATDVTTGF